MTTVQKREGSRKLQPDQNSLQQQLLRNSASDRALLVVAADRAMTRMKKGKRKAENQSSTDTRSEELLVSELQVSEARTSELLTPDACEDGVQEAQTEKPSQACSGSPSHSHPGSEIIPSVAAPATSNPSEQTQSKAVSETSTETVSSGESQAETSVQTDTGLAGAPVTSAQLLERATELAAETGDAIKSVQSANLSTNGAGPVALSRLLTRAVDEPAPQPKTARIEPDSLGAAADGSFNRQRTIDQQIHAQQLTPGPELARRQVEPAAELTGESVEIKQPVARTEVRPEDEIVQTDAKAEAQADRVEKTHERSTSYQESPTESATNDSVVSTGASDAGQIEAIQQAAISAEIPAAAPYRALRRPRKRCGTLDHRYIHSSAVNSRRALAWDDLRFRYGLLPTVEQTQASEVDPDSRVPSDPTKKSGTPVARVRRPNYTRRKAPAYVTELARLDADPALGSSLKNPFEIYQLELPLPERKSPLRERKLIESSKSSRPTQAKLSATTELNRKLRIKNKWWLLSQTVLQRTSFAMIFLALMIAGVVLFQQPVVEKKQSMHEITTFKAPQPTGTKKTSSQSESNSGNLQNKADQKAAPPDAVPDTKSITPRVDVDTIASEEIIDLVGQIEIAENLSRVPRLPRNPGSGVIIFDPTALPVVATRNAGPVEVSPDSHLFDGSDVMMAQVNPVIRSYLGPARAARKSHHDITQRRAHSTVYKGLAIDRHPEIFDFEVRLSQQSMEIFNTSILAGDRVGGGTEIAYLGVADALGKNTLSFSMSPLPNRRIDIRPFSSKFDLAPMRFFKFENRTSKPFRSIMVESDKTKADLHSRPTAIESHPVRFDTIVADNSFLSMP